MSSLAFDVLLHDFIPIHTVCVTGTAWGIAQYEVTDGNQTTKYTLHVGLNGANITMAVKDHPEDSEYSEYHNLHIGWVEGEINKINSSESQRNRFRSHDRNY